MVERLLLDENIPVTIRELLRRKGFQVRRVNEVLGKGAANSHIADVASDSKEIILTLDSDFLRLSPGLHRKARIIYLDIHPRVPRTIGPLLDQYLDECVRLLARSRVVKLTKNGPVVQES